MLRKIILLTGAKDGLGLVLAQALVAPRSRVAAIDLSG